MIAKVTRGDDPGGLVRYLLGAGRSNEHVDQRVIAVSPGVEVDLSAALDDGQRRGLVDQLETPKAIYGGAPAKGYVYHLSLSNSPGDRILTDREWAEVVDETMTDLGFSGAGRASAPWAAFRHGEGASGHDHVHVAVTMVREDGTRVSTSNDFRTLSTVCRKMEQRYGLSVVEGRTAGAGKGLSRAELEIGERTGLVPDRVRLARTVRAAAAASADEAEFVRRLRAGGLQVRPRFARDDGSRVTGFAVALPVQPGTGDRVQGPHGDGHQVQDQKQGERRWFAAGKLDKDLSLPVLRAGWTELEDQGAAWTGATPEGRETTTVDDGRLFPAAARRAKEATDALVAADPADARQWGRAARDAAGVYAQVAERLEPGGYGPYTDLAAGLARSAGMVDHHERRSSSLRGVATIAAQVATLASKGSPQGWIIVAAELTRLASAIAKAHAARGELGRARSLHQPLAALAAVSAPAPPAERARHVTASAPVFPRSGRGTGPAPATSAPPTRRPDRNMER